MDAVPEFLDNRHMKVARLSALRSGHLYPQEILCQWKFPMAPSGIEPPTFLACSTVRRRVLPWRWWSVIQFYAHFSTPTRAPQRHSSGYPGSNQSAAILSPFFLLLLFLVFCHGVFRYKTSSNALKDTLLPCFCSLSVAPQTISDLVRLTVEVPRSHSLSLSLSRSRSLSLSLSHTHTHTHTL